VKCGINFVLMTMFFTGVVGEEKYRKHRTLYKRARKKKTREIGERVEAAEE